MTIYNGSRIVNRHFLNLNTHTKILEISKYKQLNYNETILVYTSGGLVV